MTDAELDEVLRNYDERFGGRTRTHCDVCWVWADHAECTVPKLVAEVRRLRAESETVRARCHDAYLRDPGEKNGHTPTGDQLLDRLRGIYTVPVNDGAGPLNGSDTFTRRFPTLPINVEAAAEIERLRAEVRGLLTVNVGLRLGEGLDDCDGE